MSTDPVCTLAAAVRDGELSPEQREHLVTLLHTIATAAALALNGEQRYPATRSRRDLLGGHLGAGGHRVPPVARSGEHVAWRHLLAEVSAPG